MKIDCKYSRLIPSIFKGTEDEASFVERYLKIFEDIIDDVSINKNKKSQIDRLEIISGIFHPDFVFLFELFCWDEVPGSDNLRLIQYLSNRLKIDQDTYVKIEKSNDGELINIYYDLFSWDEIPGKENKRLITFLNRKFGIDWIKNAEIQKIDKNIIKIYFEKNLLYLKLSDDRSKVILKIEDGRTEESTLYIKIKIELKLNKEKREVTLKQYNDEILPDRLAVKIKNGKRIIYLFKNKDFLPYLEEEHIQKFNNFCSAGINDFLVWFAQWMGLTLKANWDVQTKRNLIAKIIPLYRMRSTKVGLEEYLKICTGYDTEIIDEMKSFQVGITSTVGIDIILGGLLPNHFIVNIKMPQSDRDIRSKRVMIEELINEEKPVHTTFRLNIKYI